jgi:hypothetical protein
MISNKKIVSYKVVDLFKIYYFVVKFVSTRLLLKEFCTYF